MNVMETVQDLINTALGGGGCGLCSKSGRPGYIWHLTQWTACWHCNGGTRPTKERKSLRTKPVRDFMCMKCGRRGYWAQPCETCNNGRVMEKAEYMHIKMTPHGSTAQIMLFFQLLRNIDVDWEAPKKCTKCGGVEVKAPILSREETFQLGKQVGLNKLKVKHWKPAGECQ